MTTPNELIAFLRGLRAVRDFDGRPVPEAALADILEVARWSGSGMNAQPWELVVVREPETLARLGRITPSAGHVGRAPLAIAVVMANGWAGEPYDEGRLTERIMLAARAHGLGSCVGWFNTTQSTAAAKELLGIPAERTFRTIVSVGYPAAVAAGARREQPRKELAEFVYDERYGARRG